MFLRCPLDAVGVPGADGIDKSGMHDQSPVEVLAEVDRWYHAFEVGFDNVNQARIDGAK